MKEKKHFAIKEGFSFLVRTENEEVEFGYPYENERMYESFEEAIEDYMKRIKEYHWEKHELVITGKDKEISFTLTISNRGRKVGAGISINVEAIESEALEKLRKIGKMAKEAKR